MLQISLRIVYAFNSVSLFMLGVIALIGPWLMLVFPQRLLTSTTNYIACNRITLSSQLLGVVLGGIAFLLFITAIRRRLIETYLANLIGRILGHTIWVGAIVAFAWVATSSSRNDNVSQILFYYSGSILVSMAACILLITGIIQVRLAARIRKHLPSDNQLDI